VKLARLMSVIKKNVTVNAILVRKTKKIILNTSRKMASIYFKLYMFFGRVQNYFFEKYLKAKKH